ncbi:trimeric intracellular cation channel family protein [Roseomonas sp. PWR1]|uniref:Trimeric intracellular cation channel family protein n=1 Tax=Roseomonas nitratireducens TaxID=2820810 RepID=A0ABS4AQ91_9PROT|nr:trimeric intracellular cation channel family protein [Neoroseomonas nitratireducens]MBP0463534.1 trimeric intracellular cation channel family protein [Neoroseomonas nitratireducens]
MSAFDDLLLVLTWAAVAVLAVAGALSASRKQLDPVGFMLVACLCAFGGGTVRDVILDLPVFWLAAPEMVALAAGLAVLVFFTAHLLERRFVVLLWADAVGLGLFAVLGAEAAQRAGAAAWVAVLMGTITATFGGVLRDIVCAEVPLILRREIYATAAALGAVAFVLLGALGADRTVAISAGGLIAFGVRAAAIVAGWSLPAYRARPGRDYPDAR